MSISTSNNDIHLYFYEYDDEPSIIISKGLNNYVFEDDYEKRKVFKKLEDLKDYIRQYIDNYYEYFFNKFEYSNFISLYGIPVFNKKKYNDIIIRLITKYPILIDQLDDIKKYLTDDTLDKLKHLIDAKNFDLI